MPFIAKNKIKRRHYYSLVKSVRVDGQPRHEILEYLGANEDGVLQIGRLRKVEQFRQTSLFNDQE